MDKAKVEAILKDQGRSKKWLQAQLGMSRTVFYWFMERKRSQDIMEVIQVASSLEVDINDII